jgi:photosystem II stability/assembly factor-like uncharacterized protein
MRSILKPITLLFILITTAQFAQTVANWAPVGTDFPVNISGQINGLGRVCQIQFDPINTQRMYAASVGGLFVSNDNGLSWTVTGTDTQLPPTACASACVDPTDNTILYLGTGDPNYYSRGFGVWKSNDAGVTWASSNTGMGNRLVVDIVVRPSDHNAVVAATEAGIYKSIDAGASWVIAKAGGDFKNMVRQPGNDTVLFAVTSSQFWRSTDFGSTWTQITNGVVIPGGGSGSGMRLATTPANPMVVYLGMIKDEGTILKSVDGGLSFTTVYHNPAQSLVGYDAGGGGQGDYNFSMGCDPTNDTVLYVVAHVVWKSVDGGVNWAKLTDWFDYLHTDMHHIIVNPADPSQLFNANDGGVWLNTNGGIASDWHPRCDGLYCAEFYNAAQSDLRKDMMNGGLQDNGEEYYSGTTWKTIRGGDWDGKPSFSYLDDRTIYYNDGNRRDVIANGADLSFNFPLAPNTSIGVMEFNLKTPHVMFASTNNIFRSTDINQASPSWTQISTINSVIRSLHSSLADPNVLYAVGSNNRIYRSDNALSGTPGFTSYPTPSATGVRASVTGIKKDPNVVYLSCGARVYRSADKGATWSNITYNLPAVNISRIYHDHFTSNETVYVSNALGVYYKDNTMTSWQNCSSGLPSISNISNLMIYNDSTVNSVMGVYYYGRGIWRSPMVNKTAPYVGVEDHVAEISSLNIYPNPNNGLFKISFTAGQPGNYKIEVINESGQIILTENQNDFSGNFSKEINITNLSKGIYLVKVSGNQKEVTKKLILY